MEMNLNGELVNFFKVRDPEECESGWAYKDENGVIRLDNSFRRIPSGSRLELEDDGYTIKSFINRNKLDAEKENVSIKKKWHVKIKNYISISASMSKFVEELAKS